MTQTTPTRPPPDDQPPHRYTAALADAIEGRWQTTWTERRTFITPNPGEQGFNATKPKFYCLDMFPYPSGAGLHVGHPEGYTATDIICRYKRMKGFNVLHPMGWDAFGLPAEQYAIQTGIHPSITTRKAIETFRRQLQRFGFSYDWSREFATIDEDYYRWTQWIFLQLYNSWYDAAANGGKGKARPIAELVSDLERGYIGISPMGDIVPMKGRMGGPAGLPAALGGEPVGIQLWHEMSQQDRRAFIDDHRLAYLDEQTVNWCPKLGTVLANEEVIDGKSERGGYPVYRRTLRQWMLRITAYAQRLLDDLAGLDWPESTRIMQTEWIGRSDGAEVSFPIDRGSPPLRGGACRASLANVAELFRNRSHQALNPAGFEPRNPYPDGIYGPARNLIKTLRNLPHLNLPGATYFVSWRTLNAQSLAPTERDQVLESLLHFDGDRCDVFAATVMPDHVHWIVKPRAGSSLDELVSSVKHFSAVQVMKARKSKGHLWDPERFDHIIRDKAYFNEFVEYTMNNPIEAGLVARAEDYAWTFVHAQAMDDSPAAERRGTQDEFLTIYTTRPDTIFGATYMVIAPEHPLVDRILADPRRPGLAEIGAYVAAARNRSDVDRMAEGKDKTGVFSGLSATNPATGERIPVWIADYVLMGVGHGAIMAVPAHDERDFEFASRFGLPIRDVVYPRVVAAMHYFTRHAANEQKLPDTWTAVLADMLGLITSENTPPARFPAVLEVVSGRRKGGEILAADPNPKIAREERESDTPERRGVSRMAWLDFIEEQGFTSFDAMRERFASATFQSHEEAAFTGPGFAANSKNAEVDLDGLPTDEAKRLAIEWLEKTGIGRRKTNFKLRDWLFSRQRYWGEPFPIVYDDRGNHYPIDGAALPVKLPEMKEYKPPESDDPAPMLAAATNWLHTTAAEAGVSPDVLPGETKVRREANTMPNWAGSCWYYLRFCDSKNPKAFAGRDAEKYWMGGNGVDLYIGGSEHAVLHLLYARFWHKVLFDLGHVSTAEPMRKLFHQGLITSYAYQDADKRLIPVDQVEERDGEYYLKTGQTKVQQIIAKMAKSLKNVVNPDDVIHEFGADTMRLYEMYMGPLDASKPWNPRDITGCFRFLQRAWRLIVNENTGELNLAEKTDEAAERSLHRLIAKVGPDIERLAFNTAIAAMMEFVKNASVGEGKPALTHSQAERFALVLAPFVPHIAEELWQRLGHTSSLAYEPWPAHDPAMLVDSHIEIPIQIMGKVRGHITVPAGSDSKAIEAAALNEPRIKTFMEGKTVKKVIVVPGKMVNIVAG